ncbi:hypothetical protein CO151_03805 [bacterium CG_4_9_14_3_um_filter_65_15]|nr:MAG: hypothetical protein CO151_03805 [bacterium CG_4_9_14_3_um_filter_65_15]
MTTVQGRFAAVLILLAAMLLAAGFIWQGQWSAVAWRDVRAVAIESDDWGLAGFIPHAHALDGLDRDLLDPGSFPAVYWESTLEDGATVSALAGVLSSFEGRDGFPAVLQPNYVMGSLAWSSPDSGVAWREYYWPAVPPAYRRQGLSEAVGQAMASGVWYPEYHALLHYDPAAREAAVASGGIAAEAARRNIMIFPGSQAARELTPQRSWATLSTELETGLQVFEAAFGRSPGSIIAPDYTWDGRMEKLWLSRHIDVIQAKREQRFVGRKWGTVAWIRKNLQLRWDYLVHRDRVYLERNCRFEPAQDPDPDKVAARCIDEVHAAWARGEAAIIEAHRINFVHSDSTVERMGREALRELLTGLTESSGMSPVYLTDQEIASLMRTGTSVCRRGDRVVVRNWTRSARLVPLGEARNRGAVCWMEAESTLVLPAD